MKLYSYWRSSSSWRVRIALAHKNLPYELVPVNLLKGEQHEPEFRARNAMGQVPVLEVANQAGEPAYVSQSAAILQYLEEVHPTPALLPSAPLERARVREICELINSGMQPLQNLAVLRHVRDVLAQDDKAWVKHWLTSGLRALESMVAKTHGIYAMGDALTLADIYIVPQLYGARRFEVSLEGCPHLLAIESACEKVNAFQVAHPNQQIDAPRDQAV